MKLNEFLKILIELDPNEFPCERGIICPFSHYSKCCGRCSDGMAIIAKQLVTNK